MNVNPLTNGFSSLSNTKAEQSSAFGVFSVILPGVYLFISSVIIARKMEQRNAIPLSVVLFLSTDNRCANGCTAADKQ